MLSVRSLAVPVATLVAAAGLSACGSDDKPAAAPSAGASASAAPSSYLPVPDGVTLTEPGTQLALGEQGVVAYQADQNGLPLVVRLSVERIERTSFQQSFGGWNIDATTAARTPYFVRVKATNLGIRGVGRHQLATALWGNDGSTLEAPNFYTKAQLPSCDGDALPDTLAQGQSAEVCQVYFMAPDHALESVLFQPPGGLKPVAWAGPVSKVSPGKPGKTGKAGKAGKPGKKGKAS
ncbi:hypothetical protein GCM10022237_36110 [Nocardioides ginsengisoli]|uniref:DUF4352 domain-containing protein n=1 Tax=Nocardioides ginsengisoli TaxID=363868 RepID=A0ABW3VZC7_9ACTN